MGVGGSFPPPPTKRKRERRKEERREREKERGGERERCMVGEGERVYFCVALLNYLRALDKTMQYLGDIRKHNH